MVASFMVFILRKGGNIGAEYDSQLGDRAIVEFNYQFEIYDKKDNTFHDIITLANLAYNTNKTNKCDPQNSVSIKLCNDPAGLHVAYSILPDKNLKQNYFIVGEPVINTPTPVSSFYIYSEKPPYLPQTLMEQYTTKDDTGKLTYSFECIETQYNEKTGKIQLMKFYIKSN